MTNIAAVTSEDVPTLIEGGALRPQQYLDAVSVLRDGAFWKIWAIRALLAIAVGHILSGIIFFFAFNWDDLSGMAKFATVGGGILACLLAWIVARLDSPAGQAFGIGATVLVGVMFAVLGQVYQTPALIHTPFVFWAILTLPFALASRNLAHWAVWLVILTVAVTTFANSGLRLAGNHFAANLLNLAVSAGCILGLGVLDKFIAPRLAWARAEWFRVLLVLGAVGFAFVGFTESFWDMDDGLWLLAVALIIGLVAYLYQMRPSLATLALASFGLFILIAQFGFKLFEEISDGTGIFLLVFLWLGGLTVGLVAAFRHFVKRFKAPAKARSTDSEDEDDAPFALGVVNFGNQTGADPALVSEVLAREAERDQPWYMEMFLAIAGVLTAILGSLFFGSFVALIMGNADEYIFGVVGAIIFALAIFLRRLTKSPYPQHILNTMIIVGGLLTAFGFGISVLSFDATVGMLLFLSLIVLVLVRDRILEFMSAAAIITLIGIEAYHLKVPMVESLVLVIATCVGVILLSRPIGTRLYKAAGTALLIAPAILGIALVHIQRWDSLADASRFSDDWPARLISLVILLGAVIYLNRGKAVADFNPPVLVLVPLVVAAACVPLGGASALLLILTGYILGSRSLALIGTGLQIYFLTMFYYDLSLDLLTKSIVLFVSGLVFLGVWVFVNRRVEVLS
ncbi:hypothetical protein GCM10011309_14630 [Litorimonas cladophorae]|uniref:DUF4401 domain-containing protein n=1 Tax=Litorimonas cladophorae TaxID=1220491 RepID=A0A918KLI6_9PROT|nr:DUF4401 domain-containing protein [Litorimonas cladophorae]GGX65451.1 hypothetical protein GCM10011309_14630 [Litorimonas cladophorae]